ncbi:SGNH/GDSL hydrolase family protein [Bradyrhizobium lablabi]|uniref:SGNH/GDSL hydrolase family protein n=1 Tax=Bradyrhizobium lablabi TaxID=722472 RepID=UPI001BAA32AE|nr:SGNH/GDSL hydrolase family protein [Bradyrhizobium lablabi]MBR0697478.1 SGNH/GDSL hydrolase family protein [Bradyrhizobium lablabi]
MDHPQRRKAPVRPQKVLAGLLLKASAVAAISLGFVSSSASFGGNKVEVVVFGDSLLDAGTYSPVAKAKFGGGRSTTNPGLNFTQLVARSYGDELTPAFVGGFGLPLVPTGGRNYAQGGSRVTMQPGSDHAAAGSSHADFALATTIPVKDQVAEFLKAHERFSPDQLIIINGGANDIFLQLAAAQAAGTEQAQQDAVKAIGQSALDLADIVGTIVKSGATHVVVFNMPDIGKTPMGVASVDRGRSLTQISQSFNLALTGALGRQDLGEKVLLLDSFSFLDDMVANYQQHGFQVSNTGFACNLSAQVTKATNLHLDHPSVFGQSLFCSPQTYVSKGADETFMFADALHPTTHLNALLAEFVEQQIDRQNWKLPRHAARESDSRNSPL